jgi:hypothetical protein
MDMRLMPCIMRRLKLCSLFLNIVKGFKYVSKRLKNISWSCVSETYEASVLFAQS